MGTNAQQALNIIDQGMGLFEDINNMTRGQKSAVGSGNAEAALLETDARGDAYEAQRKAKEDAGNVHKEREQLRSKNRANWGGANLEMSGSKAVIRDAETIRDMQDEDDVLFEGQRNADSILRQSQNRANRLRINSGSSPNRSTLSMGSKIYGPRR